MLDVNPVEINPAGRAEAAVPPKFGMMKSAATSHSTRSQV
jgi:hypothetical protein